MSACVKLTELTAAFEWASVSGTYENAAYICRSTGRVWLTSDFDDTGEDPPEDIGDESLYLTVPSKSELDLGRSLALRFAAERLPESYDRVKSFFARSGAYAQFKRMLEETGQLDTWFAYESQGKEEALRVWAKENGVELMEDQGDEG